jgi:excisionase family DNA binding protein
MKELMTSREVADYLKVTMQTIYNWRKEGVPSFRIGHEYRYDLEKVMKWLSERNSKRGE